MHDGWRPDPRVPECAAGSSMNKAFTKEDTDDVADIVVPPRAPLPEGSPNYVTARGLALLSDELKHLELARAASATIQEEGARRRQIAGLAERMMTLGARIGSAE